MVSVSQISWELILFAFHHLHLNEATVVLRAEEELETVHKLDFRAKWKVRLVGDILETGESLVDEPPLSVVQNEVADWLFLFRSEPFIRHNVAVDVPRVEILVGIDHQAMIVRAERVALAAARIEIKDRKQAFVWRPTKRTGRFGAVVEDIPFLGAIWIVAGLNEIDSFYQSGFPIVRAGTQVRLVEAVDECLLKKLVKVWPAR